MIKKEVKFKVGKETLRGSLFIPNGKGPFPGVVFFHGSGSKRERYLPVAESLAKNGILTLAFDFRGCGESDGAYEEQTHKNAIEDAGAGLDFLLNQNVDRKRIGICGGSFGGYVGAYILPEYPFIISVVFRVPAAFSDKFLSARIKRGSELSEFDFFKNRKNWEDSPTYKNISAFKGPFLVIKAEKDEVVPPEVVDKYYDKATSSSKRRLEVIKGADHRLSGEWLNQFNKLTKDWFLKTL